MEQEQERDFSFYIPRQHTFGLAQSILEKKSGIHFSHKDIVERAKEKVARRIIPALEDIIGFPLYGFDNSLWLAPPAWDSVLCFLYEEKIIAEPRFWCEPPYNDEPKFYMFGLKPLPGPKFAEVQMNTMGSSFDPEEARAKAVGEFLERYALLPSPRHSVEKASIADLKKKGRTFLDLAGVAGAFQHALGSSAPDASNIQFLWVKGKSLFEKKEILLPAQLVFWHYNPDQFSEPCIRESNSNGAAGMFSLERALLAGIQELIQRDAFLIFWLNRIAPPRITPESIENPEIQRILTTIRRYNLGVEILDVTNDFGVPAFISVLLDGAGEKRGVVIGGGCDAVSERAITSSLLEALSMFRIARKHYKVFKLPESYRPFQEDIGQQDRLFLWANPEMFPRFRWFISGEMMSLAAHKAKYQIPFGIHEELAFLIEKCKAMGTGYEIYYYEADNDILRKLNYHVVEVIIPALVPMYLHEMHAPLSTSRLKTVPVQLGYIQTSFPEPLPHPFP